MSHLEKTETLKLDRCESPTKLWVQKVWGRIRKSKILQLWHFDAVCHRTAKAPFWNVSSQKAQQDQLWPFLFIGPRYTLGPIYGFECPKLSEWCCWNLTYVTLADEDINSILTDNANPWVRCASSNVFVTRHSFKCLQFLFELFWDSLVFCSWWFCGGVILRKLLVVWAK